MARSLPITGRVGAGSAGRAGPRPTPVKPPRLRVRWHAGRLVALAATAFVLAAALGAAAAQASAPGSSRPFLGAAQFHLSAGVASPQANAHAAAAAQASLFSPSGSFGSAGTGAGQFNTPLGVAVGAGEDSSAVYVADSGNARVEKFDAHGNFIAAFGWGVADGQAKSEVCRAPNPCMAGIPGSGAGQFSRPTTVAVGQSDDESVLYVGDAGNNVVEKFTAGGRFLSTIDGASAPQGHFQSLGGVAVDQANNVWVADSGTSNVIEFDSNGTFLRQWHDSCPSSGPVTSQCATNGNPTAIAVDSAHSAVYLIDVNGGYVNRYSLTGTWQREVDRSVIHAGTGSLSPTAPSAMALDRRTGNLYVDHSGNQADVTVYDHNGVKLDDIGLSQTNSQGLAVSSSEEGSGRLYLSDASANNVTIFTAQSTPGAPLITSESATQTGTTTAQLGAGIVPVGDDTTCKFQFVSNSDFQASGFANATGVPCSPSELGEGLRYRAATADISGLATGSYYHFRVVARSEAGTTTGAEQEFQAGPGMWAPFFRCPVDDPAMLATDAINNASFCVASNSTHGSITLGKITTATGNTNLQFGLAGQLTGPIVPPSGGALVADPVQLSTPVGPVTAVTTSAGTPSNFNLFAGIQVGVPIITLPIKILLENNSVLGPNCSIGSDQNPIVLNPVGIDVSQVQIHQAQLLEPFGANGVPNLVGPVTSLVATGAVQGDDTFAVPGAQGCGPNGSLDAAVNAVAGLPSPSGSNHLVLDDTASAVGFPGFGFGNALTGQEFAAAWHVGFG